MMIRLVCVFVCTIALMVGACAPRTQTKIVTIPAPPSTTGNGTELVDFKKQTFGTPLPLTQADSGCGTRPEAQALSSDAVQGAWFGYQDTEEQTIDITTKVLDASTFEREVTNKSDLRYTVQSARTELKVCSDTVSGPSLESVGLQIKKSIDDSWAFYKKVQQAAPALDLPQLPQIGVGLLPQYEKDEKRVELFIEEDGTKSQKATQTVTIQTDNAFYSPFADDTLSPNLYAISVIPQSAEAKQQGLFNGKGLWEFPVVTHHEYGHHIFQLLFGDSTVLSFREYLDFWHKHRNLHAIYGSLDTTDDRSAFLSSPGYIFSALNEGFADLFAHYSMNEAEGLFDISCFRQTRDVLSPVMFGGLPKVWNDALWQETFDITARLGADTVNKDGKSPLELCSLPSFDDIHVMGAVIAYTVNAAFQTVIQARPAKVSPTLFKAGLLMQWVKDLRASDEVLELSNKQTLSRTLNSALGTGLRALGGADKSEFCKVVRSKFPALLTRWKEKPAEDAAGIEGVCA